MWGEQHADTLTSAAYTQRFAYDVLDRLTSGPGGTYTIAMLRHQHDVMVVGNAYAASYDAAGGWNNARSQELAEILIQARGIGVDGLDAALQLGGEVGIG